MHDENCIFCNIVKGNIPSSKVYEDDEVLAFLDISQVTKGHTLIIPKQHTKNIYETSAKVAGALFERVPKVANAIKEAYQPLGINILNNNEAFAHQSVFHLHIHLIPRYNETDGFSAKWVTSETDTDKLQEIAHTISNHVKE